jgi:hypothetical protein
VIQPPGSLLFEKQAWAEGATNTFGPLADKPHPGDPRDEQEE